MDTTLTLPKLKDPRPLLQRSAVHYPDSDGEPMAESDAQYFCITDTRFALMQHFKDEANVYVGADLLLYYAEGDATKSVAPDILVTFGVPAGPRRSYKMWDERKAPDVIFEIASESTWKADLTWKRGLYLGIGVIEYFLFDPSGAHFDPILQGLHLNTEYRRLQPLTGDRGVLGLRSELLRLELWARPNDVPDIPYVLRLYDPVKGIWLPTPAEAAERAEAEGKARRAAEKRADVEVQARRAAEAELAQLRAEVARLRGEQPK